MTLFTSATEIGYFTVAMRYPLYPDATRDGRMPAMKESFVTQYWWGPLVLILIGVLVFIATLWVIGIAAHLIQAVVR